MFSKKKEIQRSAKKEKKVSSSSPERGVGEWGGAPARVDGLEKRTASGVQGGRGGGEDLRGQDVDSAQVGE